MNEFLTIHEAANFLRMSKSSFYRNVYTKRLISFYRAPGARRPLFKKIDLEKLLIRRDTIDPDSRPLAALKARGL